MYRNSLVAVVIPAHNEERHVPAVIDALPWLVDLVVVVDDASTDGTADIVSASNRPNLALIRRDVNGGMGSAIVDGFRLALDRGADVVAVMDADGQMDPQYLPMLLDPVVSGEADFAKGNRFFSRRSFSGMPRHRIFGNIVLSFLTKIASGLWHVFDSENGYTAISADMLRRLPLDKLQTGYQFANRLLIQLSASGAAVADVPIPARYGEETSGIRAIRDGGAILRELVAGFFGRVGTLYLRGPSFPGTVLVSAALMLLAGTSAFTGALLGADGSWVSRVAVAGLVLGLSALALFFVLDARRTRTGRRNQAMTAVVSLGEATSSEASPERTPLGR